MRLTRGQAVLLFALFGPSGLVAQHATPATPPHLAAPNHTPKPPRTGHWPSWNANSGPRKPAPRPPYVYPGYLSYGYGYGYPIGYALVGDDDSAAGPQQLQPDPQMAQEAPPSRPNYVSPEAAPPPPPEQSAHPQPTTTLIFNNGQPPKQVHNYALLGANLWALDGENRQEIPLASLDIPATVKVNREAGIDFALPTNR